MPSLDKHTAKYPSLSRLCLRIRSSTLWVPALLVLVRSMLLISP
nr:MAG TPA: hypothetical protein [Caudoviricetes sp.]